MLVPEHVSFTDIEDYEVVGPQGELYGRYKTKPTPDQIPLYAMVKEVTPELTIGQLPPGYPTRTIPQTFTWNKLDVYPKR